MAESKRLHWLQFLILAIVAGAIVVLGVFGIRGARQLSSRTERGNNMHQIGISLHNYVDVYGRLPPPIRRNKDGRSLNSWRWTILQFMEMGYNMEYVDGWDDPRNRWTSQRAHWAYCFGEKTAAQAAHTNVVAITGRGTVFGEDEDSNFPFGDGRSDAILAIEVADSGTFWMEPGDLSIDDANSDIMKGIDGDGLHVLFLDADVWFLQADTPFEDLRKFFTIEGARKYDRDEVLGKYR